MRAMLSAWGTLVVLFTLLLTHFAGAAPFVWNVASPGANNWNVDANWLPGAGNPGAADTAIFSATGTSASATTITLAATNWTPLLTQAFNGVNFSFTNAINPADSQRFFLLQLP